MEQYTIVKECVSCGDEHCRSAKFSQCEDCRREEWRNSQYIKRGSVWSKKKLANRDINSFDREDLLLEQEGFCAICRVPEEELHRVFVIDHCHKTGIVRGLLCQTCNTGIGLLKDDPEFIRRAATYIEKFRFAPGAKGVHTVASPPRVPNISLWSSEMYTVVDNIPKPPDNRGPGAVKYPLAILEVGQSFVVPYGEMKDGENAEKFRKRIYQSVRNYALRDLAARDRDANGELIAKKEFTAAVMPEDDKSETQRFVTGDVVVWRDA